MRGKILSLAFLPLALLVPAAGWAAVPLKAAGPGTVSFLAVGRPSMLKIRGEAASLSADLRLDKEQLQGKVELDLEKLDTGITLRTQHMKDKYLQVKEFPKATMTLLAAPVGPGFEENFDTGGEKPFRGKLFLHGREKEVTGTFNAREGRIRATFPVQLIEFGIEVPKYLGITVADTVEVDVELPLSKE